MGFRLGIAAGVCLALCGLASAPAAEIHSIAVASTCARHLTINYFGAFEKNEDDGDISGWKLDDLVETGLIDNLKTRYAVAALPRPPTDNFGGILRQMTGRYDAFVLVTTGKRPDTIGNTTKDLEGVGVHQKNVLGSDVSALYAACEVTLVDGRTLATIDHFSLERPRDGSKFANFFMTASTMEAGQFWVGINSDMHADSVAGVTPDQKLLIKDRLQYFLDLALPWTLQRLKLVP